MKSKPSMLVEKNRTILVFFNLSHIRSGTAVQGGGKKNSNNYKEAQEIMGQIFAKASSEDPSKKNKNIFSGSGNC